MVACASTRAAWPEWDFLAESFSRDGRIGRIRAALELRSGPLPPVTDETLRRYYEYLSARLVLPFAARYPDPAGPQQPDSACTVLELLDPSHCLGDIIDGIFAKTEREGYEINLPLIELGVDSGRNRWLIDDFWYWLRNWR